MENFIKGIMFALFVLYVISPVDFVPGPIDDLVLGLAYFITSNN